MSWWKFDSTLSERSETAYIFEDTSLQIVQPCELCEDLAQPPPSLTRQARTLLGIESAVNTS